MPCITHEPGWLVNRSLHDTVYCEEPARGPNPEARGKKHGRCRWLTVIVSVKSVGLTVLEMVNVCAVEVVPCRQARA
jgi:hypothetical protein